MLVCGALFGLVALLLIESLRFCELRVAEFERIRIWLAAGRRHRCWCCSISSPETRIAGLGTEHDRRRAGGTTAVFAVRRSCSRFSRHHHPRNRRQRRHRHADLFHRRHGRRRAGPTVRRAAAAARGRRIRGGAGCGGKHADCRRRHGDRAAPASEGVYAALAASTAFLMVGHRSVYASQKIGLSKSAGLEVELGGTMGEMDAGALRVKKGSLTERVHRIGRSRPDPEDDR